MTTYGLNIGLPIPSNDFGNLVLVPHPIYSYKLHPANMLHVMEIMGKGCANPAPVFRVQRTLTFIHESTITQQRGMPQKVTVLVLCSRIWNISGDNLLHAERVAAHLQLIRLLHRAHVDAHVHLHLHRTQGELNKDDN